MFLVNSVPTNTTYPIQLIMISLWQLKTSFQEF